MAKVVDGVVDGRCGKEENLLGAASFLVKVVLKFAVAGSFAADAGNAGVAKMMGFVDQENVGVFDGALDSIRPCSFFALEVGVAVADQRLEVAGKVGQKFF